MTLRRPIEISSIGELTTWLTAHQIPESKLSLEDNQSLRRLRSMGGIKPFIVPQQCEPKDIKSELEPESKGYLHVEFMSLQFSYDGTQTTVVPGFTDAFNEDHQIYLIVNPELHHQALANMACLIPSRFNHVVVVDSDLKLVGTYGLHGSLSD